MINKKLSTFSLMLAGTLLITSSIVQAEDTNNVYAKGYAGLYHLDGDDFRLTDQYFQILMNTWSKTFFK